jgi:5-methylthioadenosine/S-adenosylhomocysteine deaminase
MNMRHGMPPILKMESLNIEPSLSVDVECTLTADFFTQMRSTMNFQRAAVNQMILDPGFATEDWWPPQPSDVPDPLTTRDVLRYVTINGAKCLRLDGKTGSLTPGKEADIIILDATRINVAPLNQVPGAVVSLMDRTNVETVIVAGKVRKWKGQLLVAEVKYLTWAEDNLLRQVVYEGLREDKPMSEVRRPMPHPKPLAEEGSARATKTAQLKATKARHSR